MTEFLKTLLHPFEAGMLPMPEAGARALVFGAPAGLRLPQGFDAELLAVNGFRPDVLALQPAGWRVASVPEGDGYDLAMVLLSRHRGLNEHWLREALARTKAGGTIIVAGGKTDGVDSLRKRVAADLALAGQASKHHGVAFWLVRPDDDALAGLPLTQEHDEPPVDGRFRTAPGMFSHDRIDVGSRLLARHLPKALKGRVADFGAGWGYLAAEVLGRGGITGLDLYEADFASLEAAKANLEPLAGTVTMGFHWHDLLSEPVARQFDAVVMNPPFHAGRAADPAIGDGFIRAASAALKPGGRLWMVANRGLPYEKALQAGFAAVEEVAREDGFKVLMARR